MSIAEDDINPLVIKIDDKVEPGDIAHAVCVLRKSEPYHRKDNNLNDNNQKENEFGRKPSEEKSWYNKQWYERNPELYKLEIETMRQFYPEAQYGFLPNGRMYWKVKINPVDKNWLLIALYEHDHPSSHGRGYSVGICPVIPNFDEMKQMVEAANVVPKYIPHMFRRNGIYYLSLDTGVDVRSINSCRKFPSAAAMINLAVKWIYNFEQGLKNQKAWDLFCGLANNRGDNSE